MQAIKAIVEGLVDFCQNRTSKKQEFVPLHNPKYKTSMCRDLVQKGKCPRGTSCTFAHSAEELERSVLHLLFNNQEIIKFKVCRSFAIEE